MKTIARYIVAAAIVWSMLLLCSLVFAAEITVKFLDTNGKLIATVVLHECVHGTSFMKGVKGNMAVQCLPAPLPDLDTATKIATTISPD